MYEKEILENTLNKNFMTLQKPSFAFSYWRPWNENSSVFDSYLDYVKDTSIVKYGADMVGQYIQSASKEQIASINKLGSELSYGLNVVSYLTLMNTSKTVGAIEKLENNTINELQKNREELTFINRKLDLQLEQQKLSNLLLQNISELLRVPDSEKERQLFIEKGIKHFVNASKNTELYEDALKNLLNAEKLADDDYFVLHRIGCIYLYVEKYLDPLKAIDYFKRASKYASVESDPKAIRLVSILNKANAENCSQNNDNTERIGSLAADSYEKAAFASYILGDFDSAEKYQTLAFEIMYSINDKDLLPIKNQYQFTLAKYQIRNNNIDKAIVNINHAIELNPNLFDAIVQISDLDIASNSGVVQLIEEKTSKLNSEIDTIIKEIQSLERNNKDNLLESIIKLKSNSYNNKIVFVKSYLQTSSYIEKIFKVIDQLIILEKLISNNIYYQNFTDSIIDFKNKFISLSFFSLDIESEKIETLIKNEKQYRLKVTDEYADGIIFYLDETGNHGLVCSLKIIGEKPWGPNLNIKSNNIKLGGGYENSVKMIDGFKKMVDISDYLAINYAAELCSKYHSTKFNDWYLPNLKELEMIYYKLYKSKILDFEPLAFWSSNQYNYKQAYNFSFVTGYSQIEEKQFNLNVLAVRKF